MSQIHWDVEGMDSSWSCSFVNDIPQVDGTGEEKPIQSNESKEEEFREERNTLYSSDRLLGTLTNCSEDISVLTKHNTNEESGSLKRGSQLSSFSSKDKRSYGLFGIQNKRRFLKATATSDSSMSHDVKVDKSRYSTVKSFKTYSPSKFVQSGSSHYDDGQKEELVNSAIKANSPKTSFWESGDSLVTFSKKHLEHNTNTPTMFFPAARETKIKAKVGKNIAKECEKSFLQHINASDEKEEILLDSTKTQKACFQKNTEQFKMCEISSEKLKRNKNEFQFTLANSSDTFYGSKHQKASLHGDTQTSNINFTRSLNVALTDARFSEKLKTTFAVAEGRLSKCLGATLPRNLNNVMKDKCVMQTRASAKRKLFPTKEKQNNMNKQVSGRKNIHNHKPAFQRLSNSKTRNRRNKVFIPNSSAADIEKEKVNVIDENLLQFQGYENMAGDTALYYSKTLEQSCKFPDNIACFTELHAEEPMRLRMDFESESTSDRFKNISVEEYQSGTSIQKEGSLTIICKEKFSSIPKGLTVPKKGTPQKKLYQRRKTPKEAAPLRRGERICRPLQKYGFMPLQFEKSQELSFAKSCDMIRTKGLGTPKENPLPTFTKEDNPQLKSQHLSDSLISNQNKLSPVLGESRKKKMTVEMDKDCNIVSPTLPKRKRFFLHNRPSARRQTKDKGSPVMVIKRKVSAKSKPPVTRLKTSSVSKTSVEDEIKLLESGTSVINEHNPAKYMALVAGEQRKVKFTVVDVDEEKLTRRTELKASTRAERRRNYKKKNCRRRIGIKQELLSDHTKMQQTSNAPMIERIEQREVSDQHFNLDSTRTSKHTSNVLLHSDMHSVNTPQRTKLVQEKITETETDLRNEIVLELGPDKLDIHNISYDSLKDKQTYSEVDPHEEKEELSSILDEIVEAEPISRSRDSLNAESCYTFNYNAKESIDDILELRKCQTIEESDVQCLNSVSDCEDFSNNIENMINACDETTKENLSYAETFPKFSLLFEPESLEREKHALEIEKPSIAVYEQPGLEVRKTPVSSFDDLNPYLGSHEDKSSCNSFNCGKRDDGCVEMDEATRSSNSEHTGLSTFLTTQANSSLRPAVAVCDVSTETLATSVENYEVTMIPDSPIDFNRTSPEEEEMSTHKREFSFYRGMRTAVGYNLDITKSCCREAIDFASSFLMEYEENVSTPENAREKETLTNPKVEQTDLQANALFNMSFMSPGPSDESPESPPDPSSPQISCVEQQIADIKTEQGSVKVVPELISERNSEHDAGENIYALQSKEKLSSGLAHISGKSSSSFSKNVEASTLTTKCSDLSNKKLFKRLDDNENVSKPKQSEPIDEIIATSFINQNSLSLENQEIRNVENSKCERALENLEVCVEEQNIAEKEKQLSNFQSFSKYTSKRKKLLLQNTLFTNPSCSFSSRASPVESNCSLQECCERSSETFEGMKKSAEESDSSSPNGRSSCCSSEAFLPENELTSSTEDAYSNAAISTTDVLCALHKVQRKESPSPSDSFALKISQCSDSEEHQEVKTFPNTYWAIRKGENVFVIKPFKAPPSAKEIRKSLSQYGMPQQKHQDPFCSDSDDIPEIARYDVFPLA